MASGLGAGATVRSGPVRVRYGGENSRDTATSPAAGDTERCPELDCIRSLLPAAVLAFAERRAERLGMGADRILIAARLIDEETYLKALGRQLGVAFQPLDRVPRAHCPLDDKTLLARAATGLLPLSEGGGKPVVIVVAPRGLAVRGLIRLIAHDPAHAARFRLTTTQRFNAFVMGAGRDGLMANAAHDLRERWPTLSAQPRRRRRAILSISLALAPLTAAALAAPVLLLTATELLLSAVFLAWLALRLTGAMMPAPLPPPDRDLPEHSLPVYTVIAALYREARSVAGLLAAIERLDYPPEKLDVIVAVEADDRETRAALAAIKTRLPITIVPVPPAGPRTKPKALNVALPFARGTYTVIYDAEDRPEHDQLRKALQAFLAGQGRLACVQSRLCIDNTDDNWLARYFTAEYAAQFDVFLPGLAALSLPLPLGGSSNHFHTETLRKVGAWDPFNVTEDADLGMRLARFGYRTGMIDSTTYEEAPTRLASWLRQRTRWFKGWMQTWLVHMREPRRLWRQLGTPGFVAFNLTVGGSALAALVHPLFLAALACALLSGAGMWSSDHLTIVSPGALYAMTAIAGYLISVLLGWLGLSRRGLLSSAWVLLLTPLHWLLLSAAAWRALHQLFAAPFAWEKTDHGLARSSRRATRMAHAPGLERDAGSRRDLPGLTAPARRTFSDRRPPLRASA